VSAPKPPPSLGGAVTEWMEAHLVHGPGDIQGEPYRLDDEQRLFVFRAYELRPNGRRQYRRAVLSRRKGRAKTELGAAIAATELLGPCRFGGWDEQGDPIAVPVRAPDIPCVATAEDQAELLYGALCAMTEASPTLAPLVDVGKERIFLRDRPGSAYLVSSRSRTRDGGRPTFTPADEPHLWTTPELKSLHSTLNRNLLKRKSADPWMLETTTMFRPGEESVAELSYRYGMQVLAGEIDDPYLLFDHLAASMDWDLDDPAQLRAAIVEASGLAAGWTDIDAIVNEFHDPQFDDADSRRFWLNQLVVAADQWLDPEAWRACEARPAIEVAAGEAITLGFDGSKFDDSTALIGCRLQDGHIFTIGIWEKPDGPEGLGWEVPRLEVDAAVARTMETYGVVRFYADPPYWQDEVDNWQAQWGDVVDHWWTNRERQMALALERTHTAVARREVTHDGDARLTRHVQNARRDERRSGTLIRKPRRHGPDKIDAAMAAVLAVEARGDAIAAGALKPKRPSRLVAF
jgi:phage terminase large subunit-like protein